MSFGTRLADYLLGLVDDSPVARRLPPRDPRRVSRMTNRELAIDWRLHVQDKAKEVREALEAPINSNSRSQLRSRTAQLLELLGEDNKGETHGD